MDRPTGIVRRGLEVVTSLLCYTGARREEVAQMKANEVRKSEDGIWHMAYGIWHMAYGIWPFLVCLRTELTTIGP
jgi:hypothetical protein